MFGRSVNIVIFVCCVSAAVDVALFLHFRPLHSQPFGYSHSSKQLSDATVVDIETAMPISAAQSVETNTLKTRFKLVICIKTSRSHVDLRNVLRDSWVGAAKKIKSVKVMFMLGEAPVDEHFNLTNAIQEETERHQDVIPLAGFTDNYRNLSSNTATVLKWLYSDAPFTFDWMLRADDDVWINIDRILVLLNTMPQRKILWGDVFVNAPVKRDGKWGHTKEEWPMDFYPPYTNGPAYLLTSDVVQWLGEMLIRNVLRLFHSAEDANVGVWLAGTNVKVVADRTFRTSFSAALSKVPCEPSWNAVHRMRNVTQMLEWSRNWDDCGCMCSCDPKYLSSKFAAGSRATRRRRRRSIQN